jgi:hypothetical protein
MVEGAGRYLTVLWIGRFRTVKHLPAQPKDRRAKALDREGEPLLLERAINVGLRHTAVNRPLDIREDQAKLRGIGRRHLLVVSAKLAQFLANGGQPTRRVG